MANRHVGKHTHRFASNPREKIAADLWRDQCGYPPIGGADQFDWLMGNGERPAYDITDRDREVAATVIQWLGSPVGNNFLRELLERFNKSE